MREQTERSLVFDIAFSETWQTSRLSPGFPPLISRSPLKPKAGLNGPPQRSCAIKDSCQLIGVFAFAVEGAADGSEGLGERKNVARDK